MEEVTVLIVMWNRLNEIKQTIRSPWKNIIFSGKLKFHIAHDDSPDGYIENVISEFKYIKFSIPVTNRRGWRRNANTALIQIESPYVFLIEDDCVCRKPINLDGGVSVMESRNDIICIRCDGVAGHDLNLSLCETKNGTQYMIIDFDSPNFNIHSNRPYLRKHRQFIENYDYYPGGLSLGETEEMFAHRVKDKRLGKFTILGDGAENKFDHIEISGRGTLYDVCCTKQ